MRQPGPPQPLDIVLEGGARVTASLYEAPSPAHAVLCLPALGVPARYYEPLAAALAQRGLAVLLADQRGNGSSSVRPGRGVDFGYAELVVDARTLADTLARRAGAPVAVLGHSLGGHVGALLAGVAPGCVQALALVAAGTPYWRCFAGWWGAGVFALAQAARWAGPLVGHFPGEHLGFGGREAARLMREWSTLARTGTLSARGLDAEAAFAAVRCPVLSVSVAGDRMAPPAAVDHLAGKLGRAPVARVHLDRERCDPQALDHFKWARYPEAVADLVAGWLAGGGSRD